MENQRTQLQGVIIAALTKTSGVSARGEWTKQEFVMEYQEGHYKRNVAFSVLGAERLERFNIKEGEQVTVSLSLNAHEWNGKWFNDILCIDVYRETPSIPMEAVTQQQEEVAPAPASDPFPPENTDKLPF